MVCLAILEATNSPFLCALAYTFVQALIVLASITNNPNWSVIGLALIFSLALSYIYFWVLKKIDGTFFWWIVVVVGGFLVIFL
jgi:hypothetical protein